MKGFEWRLLWKVVSGITQILKPAEEGNCHAADQLLPLVYAELRRLAAGKMAYEAAGHTLQATALVHEAWLRLVKPEEQPRFQNRAHFFGAAAEAMRRILVESARRKKRGKHGGELERLDVEVVDLALPMPSEDLLSLDGALDRLAMVDAQAADLLLSGLDEMRRTIREKEPVRPSTRMTQEISAARKRGSSSRGTSLRAADLLGRERCIPSIRGDLDWIVMKCLEKDRSRRYESAIGIAADVRRHLNDEPIAARAPGTWYVLRKLARRNRGALLGATLLVGAIMMALLILTVSYARIREERNQKAQALQDRSLALEAARESEHQAREQLFTSLQNQAQARRNSRQMGQRMESLKALAQAALIHREAAVRDSAIASMAMPDLQFGEVWRPPEDGPTAHDASYERYGLAVVFIGALLLHLNSLGFPSRGAAGDVDLSFDPGAGVPGTGAENEINAIALQSDGKLLLAGFFNTINGTSRQRIARLNADGSLDGSFIAFPEPDYVYTVALQKDGKVLIGGSFNLVNGVASPHVARLYGDSSSGGPSLSITQSGGFLTLSWPESAGEYQLQESGNLSLGSWSSSVHSAASAAGRISVTVPVGTEKGFFRLQSL